MVDRDKDDIILVCLRWVVDRILEGGRPRHRPVVQLDKAAMYTYNNGHVQQKLERRCQRMRRRQREHVGGGAGSRVNGLHLLISNKRSHNGH